MSSIPVARIRPGALEKVRRGHPWIFGDAIVSAPRGAGDGDVVAIEGGGIGVLDPTSPIRIRVWSHEIPNSFDALFGERLARAFARRAHLPASGTTAYRLLHGEGDRMPGIVLDRYDAVAIARPDGAAAEAVLVRNQATIVRALDGIGVASLALRRRDRKELEAISGPPPPASVEVREHGVPFFVDLAAGQKTGAFLDQRENRRRVGEIVSRRGAGTVLNLFSYAGGFSQRAALAGARVTSVDIAAGAHATAQESFKRAKLAPGDHEFVTADCFAFLEEARKRRRTWDVVISDPPSFAPNARSVPRALSAYRALHGLAARVLADGGTLCAASCSSHVSLEDFLGTLDDKALGRELSLVAAYGLPEDHPTLPSFPEGRYLELCELR